MSDTDSWVEAMSQQTKMDVAAEVVRLTKKGMDRKAAETVAQRRVVLGMQIRGRLLSAVTEATTRQKYDSLTKEEKVETLKEVLRIEASIIRKEMVDPIEAIISESHDTVTYNLVNRIEEQLNEGEDPDYGEDGAEPVEGAPD